jgi:hypothetical protein
VTIPDVEVVAMSLGVFAVATAAANSLGISATPRSAAMTAAARYSAGFTPWSFAVSRIV